MKVHPHAHGAAPGSIAGLEIGASGAGEEEGALVGLFSGGRKVRIISSQAFPTWLDKADHYSCGFQPLVRDSRRQQPCKGNIRNSKLWSTALPGESWMSRISAGSPDP